MNVSQIKKYPKAYAAYNLEETIREKSSSGGVFYLISENIISNGGVVFGARLSDTWEVEHSFCDNMEELDAFLGSKYVQSNMGDIYLTVKQYVSSGRLVLFTGTPCQLQGLKMYLERDFNNLLTVDIICHGVPSPSVWRRYVSECFDKNTISNINFRDKTEGWQNFSLKVEFDNGESYRKNKKTDLYLKGFLKNLYLRPSCYDCRFKGVIHKSDITLADFWGIDSVLPEMFDNRGASLVILQSAKGENIWEKIINRMNVSPVDINTALKGNLAAIHSVPLTEKRREFYVGANIGRTIKTRIKKLTAIPLLLRIKKKLKNIVKKGSC